MDATAETIITEVCDKHGEYQAKCQDLMGRKFVTDCPDCDAERVAEQKAREDLQRREARKRRLQDLVKGSLIPKRFAGYGFDDYQPPNDKASKALATCRKYAERFEDRLQMGGGLVLCGTPGTGKTHLACAIANHVIREFYRVALFTSVTKMARAVKATYSPKSDRTEDQVIRDFVTPDLLILDEVGAQRGTETELLLAQEIIDERYQEVRPTILISNLPESELGRYIGERALDRMYEGGGAVLAFDWESHRRAGKGRAYEHPEAMDMSPQDQAVMAINGQF
ncbi:ATP-binding protein [Alloalcanivorax xenomutans]|uniref:ATP-binding protein n=1 Tax=Alloalcanivorax xenomutans TaxID=1094342 RepID=UPI003BA84252